MKKLVILGCLLSTPVLQASSNDPSSVGNNTSPFLSMIAFGFVSYSFGYKHLETKEIQFHPLIKKIADAARITNAAIAVSWVALESAVHGEPSPHACAAVYGCVAAETCNFLQAHIQSRNKRPGSELNSIEKVNINGSKEKNKANPQDLKP